jgi:hypothetical protein
LSSLIHSSLRTQRKLTGNILPKRKLNFLREITRTHSDKYNDEPIKSTLQERTSLQNKEHILQGETDMKINPKYPEAPIYERKQITELMRLPISTSTIVLPPFRLELFLA